MNGGGGREEFLLEVRNSRNVDLLDRSLRSVLTFSDCYITLGFSVPQFLSLPSWLFPPKISFGK